MFTNGRLLVFMFFNPLMGITNVITCILCDTGYYICYTMRHLHERVEEHKHKQSSICKHYMSKHGTIPKDLTENITVLRNAIRKNGKTTFKHSK